MKGLELARRYFEEYGEKLIEEMFPDYFPRIAFGLCGEGSECLGFDDEFSRDHDFGAAFCMWLNDDDYEAIGKALNDAYSTLPKEFLGFERRDIFSNNEQRVGAMRTSDFYRKFTGLTCAPQSFIEWRRIPEHFLAIATSGEVFRDDLGDFSGIRNDLLAFYPEDIRIKKLVARVAVIAQAGQYNYSRCIKRKEYVAAECALAEFIKATMSAVYLINKKYMPFYKWAHRGMKNFSVLGDTYYKLERIVAETNHEEIENGIEKICGDIIDVLIQENLTDSRDSFLLEHCGSMMERIEDASIRSMSIFTE